MRAISVVKGSAPVMATTVDPATNRLGAWGYDLNGNATSLPGATTLNLTYDAANRVIHAADGGSVDEWYAYAADNKRVWKRIGTTGVPVVTFWGIDGTRMGEFTVETRTPQGGSLTLALVRASTPPLTFAGKRIMTEDRLGSVNGSYYPYGQPKSGQSGAGERFATYYRDATGLEYAQNRYYSTTWGRFTTPDPFKASGGPAEPGSWNRYGYVHDDPVSYFDPSGLLRSPLDPFLGGGTLKALAYADRWLFTQETKKIAIAGLEGLSESCVKLFEQTAVGAPTGGAGPSVMIALRTAAESTWFYDYDGPEALLAFREVTGHPDTSGATIRDAATHGYESGWAAVTLNWVWKDARGVVPLTHVVILPAFRSLSSAAKRLVLVHELLHVVLGSARNIFTMFKITDPKYTTNEVIGLSKWLEDGCPVPDGPGEP
jgi:RHS repeat-associated protein